MNLAEYRAELSFAEGFNACLTKYAGLSKKATFGQLKKVLMRANNPVMTGFASQVKRGVPMAQVNSNLARTASASNPLAGATAKAISISRNGGMAPALKAYQAQKYGVPARSAV